MKRYLDLIIKGIWIGGTLTVPGISGGSMAMLLGIYEPLVAAVNSLTDAKCKKKESIRYLAIFSLSAVLGIFGMSGVVIYALEHYQSLSCCFFAGAVAGGIPMMLRSTEFSVIKWYDLLNLLAGFGIITLLSFLPQDFVSLKFDGVEGVVSSLIIGLLAAIALVLPGISVSHVLLVLGAYQPIMKAIAHLQMLKLIPMLLGGILGVALTARIIMVLLEKFRVQTNLMIIGFVLGSVIDLLANLRFENIWGSTLLFSLGFVVLFSISKKGASDA